ncbi:aldehyde dehydrogenase family protein [Haloarcula onubensis]|uniref:Aldehyde dehydrogenase family protein n=1 Tax=Haloarcula onubensis TaxID=2950539 RepID=A0ABU2FV34_9EURY|nr:aldehyde dehydrogenase family protein [Halomicroarcula sp. S3CR25-11]MDS0284635.1 aldehyde dehydrogenase family protein [Halomicroarcula sp. S3CR25-11]
MVTAQAEPHVTPVVEGEPLAARDAVDVRDSVTGDLLATVALGGSEAVATALAAAEAARPSVRETTVAGRASWCERIAADVRDREAELADALVRETGVPITSARAEVAAAADQFDRVGDTLRSLTGKYRTWTTPDRGGDNSLVTAAPLGVVRCRPAGRAPLATAALQVAPALAAGNTAVLTPPPTAAVTTSLLAETVRSTVPTGVAGFVPAADGAGDDGQADAVLSAGAVGVTRLEQWLGGGATTVVYPDTDLDAAAAAITAGGPSAVGRRLVGATRVLAHESVQAGLVERLADRVADWETGDPFGESTVVGTLPDGAAARRVERQVDDAVAAGATVVRGGEVEGRTCQPTVLADVPRESALRRERVPGPVVPVTPFESAGTALRLATQTGPLGLVRVFTDRHSLAMDVADAVDAGRVQIHGSGAADTEASDGRVGLDGDATAAIERLTRTKRVRTR